MTTSLPASIVAGAQCEPAMTTLVESPRVSTAMIVSWTAPSWGLLLPLRPPLLMDWSSTGPQACRPLQRLPYPNPYALGECMPKDCEPSRGGRSATATAHAAAAECGG